MAATDGRQVLIEDGFDFPWDDEALIPRSKFFGSKDLPQDKPVAIGKAGDWVAVRVGPWTVCLKIEKGKRYTAPAFFWLPSKPSRAPFVHQMCTSAGFRQRMKNAKLFIHNNLALQNHVKQRRGQDSNLRTSCPVTDLANPRFRPLSHLSRSESKSKKRPTPDGNNLCDNRLGICVPNRDGFK